MAWTQCQDCGEEATCTLMETDDGDRDLCKPCIEQRRGKKETVRSTFRDRSKDPVT